MNDRMVPQAPRECELCGELLAGCRCVVLPPLNVSPITGRGWFGYIAQAGDEYITGFQINSKSRIAVGIKVHDREYLRCAEWGMLGGSSGALQCIVPIHLPHHWTMTIEVRNVEELTKPNRVTVKLRTEAL